MRLLQRLFKNVKQETMVPVAMTSKDYKKIIVDKISARLKPFGYKRTGSRYHRSMNDLTHHISLQSSMSSTAILLKVTVNTEIASSMLAAYDDDRITSGAHRHSHQRIGSYMDLKTDKWWTINSEKSAFEAADQIDEVLAKKVLPELDKLQTTEDLVDMFKQGFGMGLTEGQQKHYIQAFEGLRIRT